MSPSITDGEKLYVVVREDLPVGDRAVQATHAAVDFHHEHPEVATEWHDRSNTLVMLGVLNERALVMLREQAERKGIRHTAFREPDLDGSLTAIAFEPKARKLLRHLPLALSNEPLASAKE